MRAFSNNLERTDIIFMGLSKFMFVWSFVFFHLGNILCILVADGNDLFLIDALINFRIRGRIDFSIIAIILLPI